MRADTEGRCFWTTGGRSEEEKHCTLESPAHPFVFLIQFALEFRREKAEALVDLRLPLPRGNREYSSS